MQMKILLTGKDGQLGWELFNTLQPHGEVIGVDYKEVDLTKYDQVTCLLNEIKPKIIINAAAYTAVDKAESEPEKARAINEHSVRLLAELAEHHKSAFIHFSTDYVYDGRKGSPYREDDKTNPLNIYGVTKLAGEKAVQQVNGAYLIIRTSWVYSTRPGGFILRILGWARQQNRLRMVADQIGNPTWCRMLAGATSMLITLSGQDPYDWIGNKRGLYHLAGSGYTSRYEWAQMILDLDPCKQEQIVNRFEPAITSDFSTPAQRPLFSALDCGKFENEFNIRLPHWKTALWIAMENHPQEREYPSEDLFD
jgi:dTDP-4-dehydrorhamnose reductase